MIIQEPVQAAIWHCLNHYSYNDAIFLAERLHSELDTDESLFLLATCYYRSGKAGRAYSILRSKGCKTSQCKYLLARCCLDLNKLTEVEAALNGGSNVIKPKVHEDVINEFGDTSCFALQLLGHICNRTERLGKAAEAYKKSLKLNPFLWSSFESLCNLGEKVDPTKIFQVSTLENFNMCQGINPLVQMVNQNYSIIANECSSISSMTEFLDCNTNNSTPLHTVISGMHSPAHLSVLRVCKPPASDLCTPEDCLPLPHLPPTAPKTSRSRYFRSFFGDGGAISPLTPNFGVVPLDLTSPLESAAATAAVASTNQHLYQLPYVVTPSPPVFIENSAGEAKIGANGKSLPGRRGQTLNSSKPTVFSQSGNTSKSNIPPSPTSQAPLQPSVMSTVRRSSRLFSSSNSVKENNKSSSKQRLSSSKTPPRKAKTKLTKNTVSQVAFSELNEINKSDAVVGEVKTASLSAGQQTLVIQKTASEGLMNLLQEIGAAYQLMSQYNCRLAIEAFTALPPQHYNSGWVLSNVGRSHFELHEFQQAALAFSQVRHLEPHRMEGMEYYSSALWHLQQEVELSVLTQELTEFEKDCPQTWCAAGNCFSVQKEHDTAIKFFQRAIQIDPRFAYAYTLLGHEYVLTEEMDKAMACYRNAIRIDHRHYNAWYGVGMIYQKQEKFQLAEVHYRKALATNPQSSVLMCHIGVVQNSLQKVELALQTFNRAIAANATNPLCKFHRASVYFNTDRNQEALKELEELKEIAPKESLVYFLIGKVHKKLGNTHLALMNFSWATDLDPKGANNQMKDAIDKRYTNDDDDVFAAGGSGLEDVQVANQEGGDHDSSHNSSIDPEDAPMQAADSDESL